MTAVIITAKTTSVVIITGNDNPGEPFAVGALVRNISESAIIPIAGMFLTFIACYDLIQLIIEHNMNNLLIDQEASQ